MTRRTGADHEASYARLEHRAAAPLRPDSPMCPAPRMDFLGGLDSRHVSFQQQQQQPQPQPRTYHHPPQKEGVAALSKASPGSPTAVSTAGKLQSLALMMRCKLRGAAVGNNAWMAEEGKNQQSRLWLLGRGRLDHGSSGNLEPVGGFLDGLHLTKIIDSQVQLRGPGRPAGLAH
jgi:hypothetical protein